MVLRMVPNIAFGFITKNIFQNISFIKCVSAALHEIERKAKILQDPPFSDIHDPVAVVEAVKLSRIFNFGPDSARLISNSECSSLVWS